MPEETNPNPTPTPPPATPAKRSEQDQRVANDIVDFERIIGVALNDAEIIPLLARRGYTAVELNQGAALVTATARAYGVRQTAIGARRQSTEDVESAEMNARGNYRDFRKIVRAEFRAAADKTTLNLTGAVQKDLQKFITQARASYEAAKAEPYKTALVKRGYDADTVANLLAELTVLGETDQAQEQAKGGAVGTTTQRKSAAKAMYAWMGQFKVIAKVALRGRADLKVKLSL